MEIIFDTKRIRERIAEIMAPDAGRRVAIVAFVGGDVLRFIKCPKGVDVYCWPNTIATNPDGIRALMNGYARVFFVERLHMKAYWSEKRGYLVGSPNLSSNALDDGAISLYEIAVSGEDSSTFKIDEVLKHLRRSDIKRVTGDVLDEFETRYDPSRHGSGSSQKNRKPTIKPPTFDSYLESTEKQAFRFVTWDSRSDFTKAEVNAARDLVEKKTGKPSIATSALIRDSVSVSPKAHAKEWVLTAKLKANDRLGKMSWIYPHAIVLPRKNAFLKRALELNALHVPRIPFEADTDSFRARFQPYVSDRFESLDDAEFVFDPSDFNKYKAT
jgi:hypothetical protein